MDWAGFHRPNFRISAILFALVASLSQMIGCMPNQTGSVSRNYNYYLYSLNQSLNTVQAYSINMISGSLTPIGSPANGLLGSAANSIIVTPNGAFAYTLSGTYLNEFVISPSTGAISLSGSLPISTGNAFAVDPNGQFIYVFTSNMLTSYSVNSSNGALSYFSSQLLNSGSYPMAIDSSGKFVFVVNGAATVNTAAIANGVVGTGSTAITGISGGVPTGSIVTSNNFFYIGYNTGTPSTNGVLGYSMSNNGTLTALNGGAAFVGSGGTGTFGLAVDAAGKFLYASNTTNSKISAWSINSNTGFLTSAGADLFVTGALNGAVPVVDPTGSFLFVPVYNGGTSNISSFAINPITGALASLGNLATGNGTYSLAIARLPIH